MKLPAHRYAALLLLFYPFFTGITSQFLHASSALPSDSTKNPWTFSAGLDLYWGVNLLNLSDTRQPSAIYSYSQNQYPALNLGYIQAGVKKERIRANLAVMAGTYAEENLKHEPQWARFILEANLGIRLTSKHSLWLDIGVLPSHIGFESPFGKDCINLTRSIAAENSPYYNSGIKLSWNSPSERLWISLLALNGWQRIALPEFLEIPALGHQILWTPTQNTLLSSSSFVGKLYTQENSQWRIFHNFYGAFKLRTNLIAKVGFDIGLQENLPNSGALNLWFTILGTVQYNPHPKWNVATRLEWFSDARQVVIQLPQNSRAELISTSLSLSWKFHPLFTWRGEGRWMHNMDGQLLESTNRTHTMWLIQAIQFKW